MLSCTEKKSSTISADLRSKNLSKIPDSIFNFKNLIDLDLGAKYPPFSNLSENDKEKNNICELPEKISDLENLSILILNSNNLKSLPNTFSELKNLTLLDLSLNKNLDILTELPKLNQLPKLKLLFITDTKINKTSLEIIKYKLEPRVKVISSVAEYIECHKKL